MIALEQQGLRVPRDVSLVAFDDVQWMSMVDPPITTVRQPVADMARSAAELALRRLREGRQERPSTVVFRTELVERSSVAPPAGEGREGRVGSVSVAIGVDVGTSGARAVAVDERGGVVAARTSEYPMLTRGRGGRSRIPHDWWEATCDVLGGVASACRTDGSRSRGSGSRGRCTGRSSSTPRGEVIRPALLWNDQRTERQCEEITERSAPTDSSRSPGNPALTGFQAPKVLWLRDEEPEGFARWSTCCCPRTTSASA